MAEGGEGFSGAMEGIQPKEVVMNPPELPHQRFDELSLVQSETPPPQPTREQLLAQLPPELREALPSHPDQTLQEPLPPQPLLIEDQQTTSPSTSKVEDYQSPSFMKMVLSHVWDRVKNLLKKLLLPQQQLPEAG